MLRTSLPADTLNHDDVVLRYKGLEDVERFFRTLNTELDVRPIRHRLADRVRPYVLADAVLLHQLAHETSPDPDPVSLPPQTAAAASPPNPVAAAQRSNAALAKAARKHTADNTPVHSFTSLLADLATICANHIQPADDMPAFTMLTTPTPLQPQAFELLGVTYRLGM